MNNDNDKDSYIAILEKEHKKMLEALIYFVKSVRKGTIRSTKTYKKYVDIIEEIIGLSIEEIINDYT